MIKYLIMDVDGTLTDGKIYMGPNGEAMKAFSVKDGYVMTHILGPHNIMPIVITARISSIVERRCAELGIAHVVQGRRDKLAALIEIIGENALGNCAYFGDDILDLKCMIPIREAGGIIGCPSDAVQEVRAAVDYVCISKAGDGALREFAEMLIKPHDSPNLEEQRIRGAIAYLQGLSITEADVGKQVYVNEDFFYFVQSYKPCSASESKLESHRRYIDIQIVVKGAERMDFADISRLTVKEQYDAEKDVMFWNTPSRMASTTLQAGDYIILYPENAHRAVLEDSLDQCVLKLIGKLEI